MAGEGASQHLPTGAAPVAEQIPATPPASTERPTADSAPASAPTPASAPAKPIPTPTQCVRALLAPYAHIARCPACLSYALGYWPVEKDHHIQAATLSYHETGHRFDAWEHGFYGA
jgi:hypothetical protein